MKSVVFSDKSAIPALRLAWLSEGILIKVQKNPKSVILGIFYPSEFVKKLLLFSKVIKRTF
jgi:hypothetical protein